MHLSHRNTGRLFNIQGQQLTALNQFLNTVHSLLAPTDPSQFRLTVLNQSTFFNPNHHMQFHHSSLCRHLTGILTPRPISHKPNQDILDFLFSTMDREDHLAVITHSSKSQTSKVCQTIRFLQPLKRELPKLQHRQLSTISRSMWSKRSKNSGQSWIQTSELIPKINPAQSTGFDLSTDIIHRQRTQASAKREAFLGILGATPKTTKKNFFQQ